MLGPAGWMKQLGDRLAAQSSRETGNGITLAKELKKDYESF